MAGTPTVAIFNGDMPAEVLVEGDGPESVAVAVAVTDESKSVMLAVANHCEYSDSLISYATDGEAEGEADEDETC